MSEAEDQLTGKSRKRGPYLQYLVDRNVEIPKVSKWRKQRNNTSTDHGDPDGDACVSEEDTEFMENNESIDPLEEALEQSIESEYKPHVNIDPVQETVVQEPYKDPALTGIQELYDSFADEEDDFAKDEESEDEEGDKSGNSESDENQPIYPGARLTVASSMLLIITFIMRHGLTAAALTDLLILVELHCITPNLFRRSVKLFKHYFKNLRAPIEIHYYCNNKKCRSYLGRTQLDVCPFCNESANGKDISYFVVVPIIYQLQSLFQDKKFCDSIRSYRTSRIKQSNDNIEDVMDGNLYKKHFNQEHFFRGTKKEEKGKQLHISLQVNTDGVSLFRSSTFSVWPVYFIINELHPLLRFKRKYRIFAGMWFGFEKPHFKTFMKPFAETLKDLFHNGATVMVGECKLTVKALLLNGVFDSPARCLFQEFVQFNGYYGCPFCTNPGVSVKTSENGSTLTYPFNTENMVTGHFQERTHENTIKHARSADAELIRQDKESPVYGVKGSTWFMFVPHFDIVKGVAIDYMHCILLGIMKMLLTLWFDKAYRNESFYVGSQLTTVDGRLLTICPPHAITRAPRSLSELARFKATEMKAFLLYYGPACMWQILPDEYFQHFLLLVEGTYLLLQTSISSDDLSKAANLFKHFCLNIGALYGDRYQTSNVHMLLHLVQKVKDLGPLWSTSCFYFEDYNGELRHLFHGTQKVAMQVTLAVCIQQKIPEMENSLVYGSSALNFYESLVGRKSGSHSKAFISEGINSIGKLLNFKVTGSDLTAIEKVLGGEVSGSFRFTRIELRGDIIHSLAYKRVVRRNSYTVQFNHMGRVGYGQVKYYVKISKKCPNPVFCGQLCECRAPHYLAVLKCLELCPNVQLAKDDFTGTTISHIIPVKKETDKVMAVHVSDIMQLCIGIDSHSEVSFVCLFPNRFEKD